MVRREQPRDQLDRLGRLDLGYEGGAQGGGLYGRAASFAGSPSAGRASTSAVLSRSSPTVRRVATTFAVIESPTIMP